MCGPAVWARCVAPQWVSIELYHRPATRPKPRVPLTAALVEFAQPPLFACGGRILANPRALSNQTAQRSARGDRERMATRRITFPSMIAPADSRVRTEVAKERPRAWSPQPSQPASVKYYHGKPAGHRNLRARICVGFRMRQNVVFTRKSCLPRRRDAGYDERLRWGNCPVPEESAGSIGTIYF